MIDEKLDTMTHDMAYTGYDEQLVDGKDQVVQNVKIRLKLMMGELFDDVTRGIDYMGFYGKSISPSVLDAMIKSMIRGTPEVTGIASYSSTINSAARLMVVSAKIDTIYGQGTLNNLELLQ